jgi:hypothetical protein
MRKIKYIILLVSFLYGIGYSYTTATVESVGSVTNFVSGVESIFTNPAFISNIKGTQIMVDYKKFFPVSSEQNVEGYTPADISNILFAIKFDFNENLSCGIGTGLLNILNFYNETELVFASGYSKNFGDIKLNFAGQVVSKTIDFSDTEYGKTKKFYINTFVAIEYKNFVFSFLGNKMFKKTDDEEPVELVPEITYNWLDKILFSVGLQTVPQIELKTGVEWKLKENLSFRSGINNNEFSIGLGMKIKKIYLNISSVYPYRFFQPLPQLRTGIIYNW